MRIIYKNKIVLDENPTLLFRQEIKLARQEELRRCEAI